MRSKFVKKKQSRNNMKLVYQYHVPIFVRELHISLQNLCTPALPAVPVYHTAGISVHTGCLGSLVHLYRVNLYIDYRYGHDFLDLEILCLNSTAPHVMDIACLNLLGVCYI